jgi:hypothetical protein
MRVIAISLAAGCLAAPVLSAQPNPFKVAKPDIRGASIAYAMTGDMTGTATAVYDGDRYLRASNTTVKIMGSSTTVNDWTLTTADSVWRADLTKKEGTVGPNMIPVMARAYDDLDKDGKKRFHQNMQDMSALLGRAFGFGNLNSGETLGTRTIAGQECEERKFGDISVCQMKKAPIALHTQASLMCMKFEETATEVQLAPPPADKFAPPADVVFTLDPNASKADSVARGFVGYLSSQQLADSLAKAKEAMGTAGSGQTNAQEMTPEQKANAQAACEAFKSIDMNKVMADAANAWQRAMVEAMKNEAKNQATKGIKGLIKKPKIP